MLFLFSFAFLTALSLVHCVKLLNDYLVASALEEGQVSYDTFSAGASPTRRRFNIVVCTKYEALSRRPTAPAGGGGSEHRERALQQRGVSDEPARPLLHTALRHDTRMCCGFLLHSAGLWDLLPINEQSL